MSTIMVVINIWTKLEILLHLHLITIIMCFKNTE